MTGIEEYAKEGQDCVDWINAIKIQYADPKDISFLKELRGNEDVADLGAGRAQEVDINIRDLNKAYQKLQTYENRPKRFLLFLNKAIGIFLALGKRKYLKIKKEKNKKT